MKQNRHRRGKKIGHPQDTGGPKPDAPKAGAGLVVLDGVDILAGFTLKPELSRADLSAQAKFM